MPFPITANAADVLAVVLAAAGAVLFGLAAVRQHGAVQAAGRPASGSLVDRARAGLHLVRRPAWLRGAAQAGLGGALHIVALALAPITLVQPIGVLAVPVTVIAAAVHAGRRPRPTQILGSVLSVAGLAALTGFLLQPAAGPGTAPGWAALAITVGAVVASGVAVIVTGDRGRPALRCVRLAVTAAMLFGLTSILVRTLGAVVTGRLGAGPAVVVVAASGIVAAVPLGVWAVQAAYLSGVPQVVICVLTLVDPLTAVVGGRLLLHDGGAMTGLNLLGVLAGALLAAGGVVLLSRDYPAKDGRVEEDLTLEVSRRPTRATGRPAGAARRLPPARR